MGHEAILRDVHDVRFGHFLYVALQPLLMLAVAGQFRLTHFGHDTTAFAACGTLSVHVKCS